MKNINNYTGLIYICSLMLKHPECAQNNYKITDLQKTWSGCSFSLNDIDTEVWSYNPLRKSDKGE